MRAGKALGMRRFLVLLVFALSACGGGGGGGSALTPPTVVTSPSPSPRAGRDLSEWAGTGSSPSSTARPSRCTTSPPVRSRTRFRCPRSQATAVAVSKTQPYLFYADSRRTRIFRIDLRDVTIPAVAGPGGVNLWDVKYSPDGSKLYFTESQGVAYDVVDPVTMAARKVSLEGQSSIVADPGPKGIAFDGSAPATMYLTDIGQDLLTVDTARDALTSVMPFSFASQTMGEIRARAGLGGVVLGCSSAVQLAPKRQAGAADSAPRQRFRERPRLVARRADGVRLEYLFPLDVRGRSRRGRGDRHDRGERCGGADLTPWMVHA